MTSLLKVKRNILKNPPIWLLRQAGRYLPEYMAIRKTKESFLDLCYDSENACKVTMQPIDRFDLDSAILFSDILVLPHVMGWKVEFKEGEGPVLEKFQNPSHLKRLDNNLSSKVDNIYQTVSNIRSELDKNKSLIGFAGSPWTVASYMISGCSKHDFSECKNFVYQNYELTKELIKLLTEKTIEYLSGQVEAGADVVMLFDSWSGVLCGKEFEELVIEPTAYIIEKLKEKYTELMTIGFPRGSGYNYDEYIEKTKIDVISVDQFVPLKKMASWQENIIVQGNLDPVVLLGTKEQIKEKVDAIFTEINTKNFIFNLGHGILPATDPENVEFLVKYVRERAG